MAAVISTGAFIILKTHLSPQWDVKIQEMKTDFNEPRKTNDHVNYYTGCVLCNVYNHRQELKNAFFIEQDHI